MEDQTNAEMLDEMIGTTAGDFDETLSPHEILHTADPREKYYSAPREPDKRRVASEERKRFEVDKMWELHHEIVRRTVVGQSNVDIARSLGVSEVMVSYTLNSEVCKKKVSAMRAERDAETVDIAKEIREFAIQPLELLKDIIRDKGENNSMSLVAKTSENWLDRAGYGATKKIEAVIAHLTAEEIEQIKKDARVDARASGTIIETQAEVIKNQEKIINLKKEV